MTFLKHAATFAGSVISRWTVSQVADARARRMGCEADPEFAGKRLILWF